MSPDPAGCQPVRTHIRRTFNNGGEATVARLRGAHLARSKGMHGVLGGLLRGLRALRAVRLELTQRVVRLSTQLGDELVRCRGGGSRHVRTVCREGPPPSDDRLARRSWLAAPPRWSWCRCRCRSGGGCLPRTGLGTRAGGNGTNFMLHDINLASRPPTRRLHGQVTRFWTRGTPITESKHTGPRACLGRGTRRHANAHTGHRRGS